jgi:hypothetical protein
LLLTTLSCSTAPLPKAQDVLGWEKEEQILSFPDSETALTLRIRVYEPSFKDELRQMVIYLHFASSPMSSKIRDLEGLLSRREPQTPRDTIFLLLESQGPFPLPVISNNREVQPYLELVSYIQSVEKSYQLGAGYRRTFVAEELAATEGLKWMNLMPGYLAELHIANPWLEGGEVLLSGYQGLRSHPDFAQWNMSREVPFLTLEKAYSRLKNLRLNWFQELVLAFTFHHLPQDSPPQTWLPVNEGLFLAAPLWDRVLAFGLQAERLGEIVLYQKTENAANFLNEDQGQQKRILRSLVPAIKEKKLPQSGSLFQTFLRDF